MTLSAILHIPHSSTVIPPDVRSSIQLADAELDQELIRMTDAHTDVLFGGLVDVATPIVFPVSRLVVDPERFEDDDLEPMAARGMGAIYTETSHGRHCARSRVAGRGSSYWIDSTGRNMQG